MKYILTRTDFTDLSSIGNLCVENGDRFFSYTLEDKDRQRQSDGSIIPWTRDLKVPKETAIAYGTYPLITNYSGRFKRVMPLLLNVPDFTGIRMHNGCSPKDTEGCQLLGYTKELNFIGQSVVAFNDFMKILLNDLKKERVHLTITPQIIGA